MKLYYSPGACSLAVHIALEELGLPYETELVSTSDGSTRSEAHLARNPKGRVPVLELDGAVMTEAVAIMTYLAASHPDSVLGEVDPMRLSRAVEWMGWLSSGVHAGPVAQCWRTERFTDDPSAHGGVRDKGLETLRAAYDMVEGKLGDGKWALGGRYSVVDPTLLVYFRWGNRLGLAMPGLYPRWTGHTRAMLDRPAVRAVMIAEDVSAWA